MRPADRVPVSVSVVVCGYSDARRNALLAALDSLAHQTVDPLEVIAVVDHNRELRAWLGASVPGVVLLENEHERGLAGARNTGVSAASGDVVAFLDDDARAAPTWIERLGDAYRDPRVIGAGGAVLPEFEDGRPRWLPEEFDWVVGCSYRGLPSEPSPVRNLIGCNMSFRRDVLLRSGGFTIGLGRVGAGQSGCEETELCIRLQQGASADAVIVYDPATSVQHLVPKARTSVSYFVGRCRAEGRSKMEVARRCGLGGALESERAYTRRTLPAAIRTNLRSGAQGDPAGLARAGAIVLGLAATSAGFLSAARTPVAP
jgi:GT2 family glycosyltransferase